jgi:hypothetical protein
MVVAVIRKSADGIERCAETGIHRHIAAVEAPVISGHGMYL